MKRNIILFMIILIVIFSGCTHNVTIKPDIYQPQRLEYFPIKVAYVISNEDFSKPTIVKAAGDKLKYYPYQALDYVLNIALNQMFKNAEHIYNLESVADKPDITLIFHPTISTVVKTGGFYRAMNACEVGIRVNVFDYNEVLFKEIVASGGGDNSGNRYFAPDDAWAGKKALIAATNDLCNKLEDAMPLLLKEVQKKSYTKKRLKTNGNFTSGHKENIAIIQLDTPGLTESDAIILTNRLRYEIFQTEVFNIFERDKMDEILKEQGYSQTGIMSSESLVEVGKLLNVELIAGGSVSKIGEFYSIELRLFEVRTGQIISMATEDINGTIGFVLKDGLKNAILKLLNK